MSLYLLSFLFFCCSLLLNQSLLDFLAGRKDKSGFDGNILVNGQKIPDDFKNISGYVVQVNVMKQIPVYLTPNMGTPQ